LGAGHSESLLVEKAAEGNKTAGVARSVLLGWRVFQFHDTSETALIRQNHYINDNTYLRNDAGNLAPFLYMLQQTKPDYYSRIVATIRQIAPFFGDFVLHPSPLNPNEIFLDWLERDHDVLFGAHQVSDGTLRMMALLTLLMQPEEMMPGVIVIDEPELGLHPYAIAVIASLIRGVSERTQVLLCTQSARLVDEFEPADIVVVDRVGGESTFQRQGPERLRDWLEEYSLGELWEKNVLGGRPAR
jgi:predicted ATPase